MLIYTKVQNHRSESYRRFSSTSHWQNGGVYGKLKVLSSYAANAFCIGFFCNLATDKKALATCRPNRNFQLRFSATSPMRKPLYAILEQDNKKAAEKNEVGLL